MPQGGPGTELTAILHSLGIKDTENCACRKHATQMDAWGPEKCRENMELIVSWMLNEAQTRGWPIPSGWLTHSWGWVARRLVKRAIRNAERKKS